MQLIEYQPRKTMKRKSRLGSPAQRTGARWEPGADDDVEVLLGVAG
jgi:hypothetical protein